MFKDAQGREWRNLYEQVQKNKDDIEYLKGIGGTLNEFGIMVLGVLNNASLLPSSDNQYGDAYAVGVAAPYDMYIWTRTEDPEVGQWLNLGQFPAVGPQGPIGETGPQGPQGIQGPQGNTGLQGVQGPRGNQGPKGDTGETGPQGIQGPQGQPGNSFHITAQLGAVGQLPAPTKELQMSGTAYQVGTALNVYIIVGNDDDGYTWVNCGPIGGIEGPQGPQGIQGATGAQGQQGIQGPQGEQGIQGATGPRGYTYTPVMTGTTLSWTNDGGLTNPAAVNLKGDTGAIGPQGPQGPTGPRGTDSLLSHVHDLAFDYNGEDVLHVVLLTNSATPIKNNGIDSSVIFTIMLAYDDNDGYSPLMVGYSYSDDAFYFYSINPSFSLLGDFRSDLCDTEIIN